MEWPASAPITTSQRQERGWSIKGTRTGATSASSRSSAGPNICWRRSSRSLGAADPGWPRPCQRRTVFSCTRSVCATRRTCVSHASVVLRSRATMRALAPHVAKSTLVEIVDLRIEIGRRGLPQRRAPASRRERGRMRAADARIGVGRATTHDDAARLETTSQYSISGPFRGQFPNMPDQRYSERRRFAGLSSCRRRDSNPRHADYDSAALTD